MKAERFQAIVEAYEEDATRHRAPAIPLDS